MYSQKIRNLLPRLTSQFITPKQAYMAKTNTEIVVKLSRGLVLLLNDDGTWCKTTTTALQKRDTEK